jgi:hypothetical protein
MPVEITFYQHLTLSLLNNPISECMVIGKDVVFQVSLDLRDPRSRTNLSFWILRAGVHGVPRDAYDPWRAPWNYDCWDHQLRGAGLAPFAQFDRPGCWSLQPSLKDTIRDRSTSGGLH